MDGDAGPVDGWAPRGGGQADAGEPRATPTGTPGQTGAKSREESNAERGADPRILAVVAHVSILACLTVAMLSLAGPLLVWLVPAQKDPFVVAHAKEALNFQLTVFLAAVAGLVLYLVLGVATLGIGLILLLPVFGVAAAALAVGAVVFAVLAAMAANRGEAYRYPLCIRFVP